MNGAFTKCFMRFYSNNFCYFYVNMRLFFINLFSVFSGKYSSNGNNKHHSNTLYDDEPGKFQLNYHIYDITHDIIKLRYFILNKEHKICIPRVYSSASNIRQIYNNISAKNAAVHQMLEYPILDATLNDNIDLTERLCQYIGHEGNHILYAHPIKIAWILTPNEITIFERLCIITDKCKSMTYYDINDIIII